jgi:hypothetical protein
VTALNVREEKLLAALVSGQSQSEAARTTGYDIGTVSRKVNGKGESNPRNVTFRQRLIRAIEAAGYGEEGVADKLRQLLDARQHGLTRNGDVVEMGPDAHAQAKAMDMVLKVTGSYPDPRLDINHSLQAQVVILDASTLPQGDVFTLAPEDVNVVSEP